MCFLNQMNCKKKILIIVLFYSSFFWRNCFHRLFINLLHSFSFSSCLSFWLIVVFSVCLYVSLFINFCLWMSNNLFLCLYLSVSLFLSIYESLPLFLSFIASLSLSIFLVSPSLCLSVSLSISMSLCLSVSLFSTLIHLQFSWLFCLFLYPSHYMSVFLYLNLYSISTSDFMTPCLCLCVCDDEMCFLSVSEELTCAQFCFMISQKKNQSDDLCEEDLCSNFPSFILSLFVSSLTWNTLLGVEIEG